MDFDVSGANNIETGLFGMASTLVPMLEEYLMQIGTQNNLFQHNIWSSIYLPWKIHDAAMSYILAVEDRSMVEMSEAASGGIC